ncbi:hypothetical protein V6N13_059703 [Hibiscus sabdariffa]|uniref:Uncharacterized protein n=1 Tax=Hibiscus sabdariffa TaxID=183260 RepID=A0ABR2GCR7_9ROSI
MHMAAVVVFSMVSWLCVYLWICMSTVLSTCTVLFGSTLILLLGHSLEVLLSVTDVKCCKALQSCSAGIPQLAARGDPLLSLSPSFLFVVLGSSLLIFSTIAHALFLIGRLFAGSMVGGT